MGGMHNPHSREKLIEAIIYFARNAKNLGKTKLLKLLYFLDFIHFRQTGKSVTGLDYYAWDMGPVPSDLWYELAEETLPPDLAQAISIQPVPLSSSGEMHTVKARRKFNPVHFTPRERRIMEQLADVFRDATAKEMVEVSHLRNQPWDRTIREKGDRRKIDYLLAVDSSPDALPLDIIEERLADIEEMEQLFG